jgi:recombination associated protein RdgC
MHSSHSSTTIYSYYEVIMGLLSSSVSITRYIVKGKIEGPLLETVTKGLQKYRISEIDDDPVEKISGWTALDSPFEPDFDTSSCVFGTYFLFSLRLDKKNIPSKIIKKHTMREMKKRLKESGREHLSRSEKKTIQEHVTHRLSVRIPATPNMYDVVWNYEESVLWFFTNLKAANEELETLFSKSFDLTLIRVFPYTSSMYQSGLSEQDQDALSKLNTTNFMV